MKGLLVDQILPFIYFQLKETSIRSFIMNLTKEFSES